MKNMSLNIHNNLSNKKEEFISIEPGKVNMYVCGVTVYDDIHMGHARNIIVFDMVAKYLRYLGYEVTHVTNFTDVDDKIINRATEEGMDPLDLSKKYIERYFEDIESLGINLADFYPTASENIDNIICMIAEIIDNGYGYKTDDGSVYFEVEKVKDYGKLSNQKLEYMESSGRVNLEDNKKNPMDFAVWKSAKPGECAWCSPWGDGRPGWHIECSAMIRERFGDTIDIHGGGNDLIFPHHENELLQTEAVTGKPLSNYWMHNGMLQVQGEKMSKSMGNFFKVRDVSEKYEKESIRFYFLNTHYSSPLMYSEEMVEESHTALKRLWNNYRELESYSKNGPDIDEDICYLIDETKSSFIGAMNDDFNTRAAIEILFQLVRTTNKSMSNKTLSKKSASKIYNLMSEFDIILGILPPKSESNNDDLDSVMKILMNLRNELRSRKQYDLADDIRDKLIDAGISLEDSTEGMKWKKM